MKKNLLFILAFLGLYVFMFPFVSVAIADDSNGCGLGTMIAPKKSLISATTRYISNYYLCSNQTFGVTSGTSGCTRHSLVKSEMAPQYFAEANIENLKVEMSRGEGEYLMAFADTLGCGMAAKDAFYQLTKKEYSTIFNKGDETPTQMLNNVKTAIKQNQQLKGQCQNAII
jgi:hypothetical protein